MHYNLKPNIYIRLFDSHFDIGYISCSEHLSYRVLVSIQELISCFIYTIIQFFNVLLHGKEQNNSIKELMFYVGKYSLNVAW